MSDTIHLVQVEGGSKDVLDDVATELGTQTDDNIVVTNKTVEPLDRDEVKDWLQQFADCLDMELVDK